MIELHVASRNGVIPFLNKIDLLSYEYNNVEYEKWEEIISKYDVRFATIGLGSTLPIGFVVGCQVYEGFYIARLAVHPNYRRMGVGSMLVGAMAYSAKANYQHNYIRIDTPETIVCPGQPGDASVFLKSCGFKAIKTTPDQFLEMGERVGGITWSRAI